MMMLEWEGKALLRHAGVAVPNGQVVQRGSDVAPFDGPVAVKAQVRSGGRGKEDRWMVSSARPERETGKRVGANALTRRASTSRRAFVAR